MYKTNNLAETIRVQAWRRMSPDEKYSLFMGLMKTVHEIKTAGVQAAHPDWTAEEIQKEVAKIYLRART